VRNIYQFCKIPEVLPFPLPMVICVPESPPPLIGPLAVEKELPDVAITNDSGELSGARNRQIPLGLFFAALKGLCHQFRTG
jgi:hypothetical protein